MTLASEPNAHQPNLADEVRLADGIEAPAPSTHGIPAAKHVLVSGLTGFLGGYLGAALLGEPGRTVYGLARRRGSRRGAARLASNLRDSGGEQELEQLSAVEGELTEPRFGLDQRSYDELADSVDAVVHCAASVNLLAPYSALRRSNVLGTLELLRFAAHRRAKDVHFVSTSGIFLSPFYRGAAVAEDDPATSWDGLRNGYAQSKWVADSMVRGARARGLVVNVYRPAFVGWHSRTGHPGRHDLIANLISLSRLVGSAPRLDIQINSVPVDAVASDIARLFEQGASNRTFHVVNSRTTNFLELAQPLGLPLVPGADWTRRLAEAAPAFADFAKAVCRAHDDDGSGGAELRRENHRDYRDDDLRRALGETASRASPIDPEYLALLQPAAGTSG